MANADRWADSSKFSRDLIDLAIMAFERNLPREAIIKAKAAYPDAIDSLKEALVKFQAFPDYRARCYQALQISNPVTIIDGIDYLARKISLYAI